jgi:hypothetical protein
MNANDEEMFLLQLRTIELTITRVWALQGILDHQQVPGWRETSAVIELELADDVRRKLQPLFDAVLGKPARVPENNPSSEWQEQVRQLIDGTFDPGPKP